MTKLERTLRSAARKLGPERCEQALMAWVTPIDGWAGCALGRAYGAPGALLARLTKTEGDPFCEVARIFRMTVDEVEEVACAFDWAGEDRDLLRSILEDEAAKARTRYVETEVPVPAFAEV